MSARNCGCDPEAGHTCEGHLTFPQFNHCRDCHAFLGVVASAAEQARVPKRCRACDETRDNQK